MSVILAGIDGTGSEIVPGQSRDEAYDIAFANSFVRTLCSSGPGIRGYWRGPVGLGGGLMPAVNGGVSWIKQQLGNHSMWDVILTGYSRGAAGVVMIANRLKRDDINVKAMMLFDCVDRYLFGDASVIPTNVQNVKHVIRDPAANSRHSFGNDGLQYYREHTNYRTVIQYMCTHGGMGGCPWEKPDNMGWADLIDEGALEEPFNSTTAINYRQDRDVSQRVWSDCLPYLRQYKFM